MTYTGTILRCPRCDHEFRRKYAPMGFLNDARAERDRAREALELIARLEDDYRAAGLPYDLDTGAQMASRRAGNIARKALGLPPRESAYDPPLGRSKT